MLKAISSIRHSFGQSNLFTWKFSRLILTQNFSRYNDTPSIQTADVQIVTQKRSLGQFRPRAPVVHRNISSAMNVFYISEYRLRPGVEEMLEIYKRTRKNYKQSRRKFAKKKRRPLIVLEGLSGSGKTAIGRTIAKSIGAVQRGPSTNTVAKVRRFFEDGPRRLNDAFNTVVNYIEAMEFTQAIYKKIVILERFHHWTAALSLAQAAYEEVFLPLPGKGDKAYRWPDDLIVPDIAFFLDVDDRLRRKRHCRPPGRPSPREQMIANDERYKKLVLTALKRMRSPKLVFIDGNPKLDKVVEKVEEKIAPIIRNFVKK